MSLPVQNTSSLEASLKKYAEAFALQNHAAKVVMRGLSLVGVGLRPVLDHIAFRTLHLKQREQEFLDLGYEKDVTAKVLLKKGHGMEVFRRGCAAAIILEHPHEKSGLDWIAAFGDREPYYLAVRVEDLDEAVFCLEKQGIGFLRPMAGHRDDHLRQVAAVPEMKNGKEYSHLVLVERHAGGPKKFTRPIFGFKLNPSPCPSP
ncbi:hypothetical protein LDC_0900 [sediment metagenome]|uniref:VOC domain-containing protein n=1 Tax=sediment metagenome TaxID=749907 RepID=D9PHA0_9ZZZZ